MQRQNIESRLGSKCFLGSQKRVIIDTVVEIVAEAVAEATAQKPNLDALAQGEYQAGYDEGAKDGIVLANKQTLEGVVDLLKSWLSGLPARSEGQEAPDALHAALEEVILAHRAQALEWFGNVLTKFYLEDDIAAPGDPELVAFLYALRESILQRGAPGGTPPGQISDEDLQTLIFGKMEEMGMVTTEAAADLVNAGRKAALEQAIAAVEAEKAEQTGPTVKKALGEAIARLQALPLVVSGTEPAHASSD